MKIMTLGGNPKSFEFSVLIFKGYVVPPKRDVNFMFVKGIFNKTKKVIYFKYGR